MKQAVIGLIGAIFGAIISGPITSIFFDPDTKVLEAENQTLQAQIVELESEVETLRILKTPEGSEQLKAQLIEQTKAKEQLNARNTKLQKVISNLKKQLTTAGETPQDGLHTIKQGDVVIEVQEAYISNDYLRIPFHIENNGTSDVEFKLSYKSEIYNSKGRDYCVDDISFGRRVKYMGDISETMSVQDIPGGVHTTGYLEFKAYRVRGQNMIQLVRLFYHLEYEDYAHKEYMGEVRNLPIQRENESSP
jgi:cell division protein FtsB